MIALELLVLPDSLAVCKLPPADPSPGWATSGPFSLVTRSPTELSIVCRDQDVPMDVVAERGWRGLCVTGRLDFSKVGVLTSLLDPLAQAGIAVFVVSTFDTDSLLVKANAFDRAVRALRDAGHDVLI
jgi:hypothetical protein